MTKTTVPDYVPAEHWELAVAEALLPPLAGSALSGTVLVAPAGVGVFGKLVAEALPVARRVMFVSAHAEHLDAVRTVLKDSSCPAFFAQQAFAELAYAPGVFEAAFCTHGLVDAAGFRNRASDLAAMVETGGLVGIAVLGRGSLPIVRELITEEVYANAPSLAAALADYGARRLTADDVDEALSAVGLELIAGGETEVHIAATPSTLLGDPLLVETLMPFWESFESTAWSGAAARLEAYFEGERVIDTLELQWRLARVSVVDVDDALIEDVGNAFGEASVV